MARSGSLENWEMKERIKGLRGPTLHNFACTSDLPAQRWFTNCDKWRRRRNDDEVFLDEWAGGWAHTGVCGINKIASRASQRRVVVMPPRQQLVVWDN